MPLHVVDPPSPSIGLPIAARRCFGTSHGLTRTCTSEYRAGRLGSDELAARAAYYACMGFHIANEPAADKVLDEYPFAVLMGMMLDQQYGMEHAFRGGWKVLSRFGNLDPAAIAAAEPEAFKELCSQTPAIHRFPGSMSARLQELATLVESKYDGDVTRLWTEPDHRQGALQARPGAPRLRQAEGPDLRSPPRQATRHPPRGLGSSRRRLRPRRLPLSRRRRRRHLPRQSPRVQTTQKGRSQSRQVATARLSGQRSPELIPTGSLRLLGEARYRVDPLGLVVVRGDLQKCAGGDGGVGPVTGGGLRGQKHRHRRCQRLEGR